MRKAKSKPLVSKINQWSTYIRVYTLRKNIYTHTHIFFR